MLRRKFLAGGVSAAAMLYAPVMWVKRKWRNRTIWVSTPAEAFAVPVNVTVRGVGGDFILMPSAELMAKPMSGDGWTFLLGRADAAWGTPTLATQNSFVQTLALAGALVYARTGTASYKTKVETALKAIPGTDTGGALATYRQVFAWVCAADLVGFNYTTICDNGQTWQEWLEEIRTKTQTASRPAWQTMSGTSQDTCTNWGAYATAGYLAVSIALNDSAGITQGTNVLKRVLGDTSVASEFNASASYAHPNGTVTSSSNGPSWDMSWLTGETTIKRGINPYSAGLADARDGMLVEDGLRFTSGGADSVACCTPNQVGVDYTAEALDGWCASMQVLKTYGTDLLTTQDSALKRAFDWYDRWGRGAFALEKYLAHFINYHYGTSYTESADTTTHRAMGFGNWLFT